MRKTIKKYGFYITKKKKNTLEGLLYPYKIKYYINGEEYIVFYDRYRIRSLQELKKLLHKEGYVGDFIDPSYVMEYYSFAPGGYLVVFDKHYRVLSYSKIEDTKLWARIMNKSAVKKIRFDKHLERAVVLYLKQHGIKYQLDKIREKNI